MQRPLLEWLKHASIRAKIERSLQEKEPDLATDSRPQPGQRTSSGGAPARPSDRTFELKSEIHRKLIGALNLERVASVRAIAFDPKSATW